MASIALDLFWCGSAAQFRLPIFPKVVLWVSSHHTVMWIEWIEQKVKRDPQWSQGSGCGCRTLISLCCNEGHFLGTVWYLSYSHSSGITYESAANTSGVTGYIHRIFCHAFMRRGIKALLMCEAETLILPWMVTVSCQKEVCAVK